MVRALIVGAGGMGRGWGRNARDNGEVEIAGWADVRPDAAAPRRDPIRTG